MGSGLFFLEKKTQKFRSKENALIETHKFRSKKLRQCQTRFPRLITRYRGNDLSYAVFMYFSPCLGWGGYGGLVHKLSFTFQRQRVKNFRAVFFFQTRWPPTVHATFVFAPLPPPTHPLHLSSPLPPSSRLPTLFSGSDDGCPVGPPSVCLSQSVCACGGGGVGMTPAWIAA